MELYKKIDEYIGKIAPIAFLILTFFVCINRIPFFDEAHSFLISQFSLKEIFYLARTEGHPILWYLIIKPFNNIDWYPYPMLMINWIFMMCAMYIFWKKAPFNNIIKLLISFSFPIFQYYAVTARPYGLGVLVLFLLTAFYKESTKKPVLYAFLLILCANISATTCIACVGFGLVFLYNIYKEKKLSKKQLFQVGLVLFIGFILLCCQFLHVQMPDADTSIRRKLFLMNFANFIFNPFLNIEYKTLPRFILELISFIMFYTMPFILFKKDKKIFTLIVIPVILFIYFFINIYPGEYWHYYLIFILLISGFWISWEKLKNIKFLYILFIGLILANSTSYVISNSGKTYLSEPLIYRKILNLILNSEEIKNAKLFCFDHYTPIAPGIVPYLKRNNILLYDNHNNDRSSFENIKNIANIEYRKFVPSEFVNYLSKNRENYFLAKSNRIYDYQDFSLKDENYIIYFDVIKRRPEMYFILFKIRAEKIK